MIFGERFLYINEAKEIDPKKEKIVQSTANVLKTFLSSHRLGSTVERQVYGTLAHISNNKFLKSDGTKYTYYVLSKNIKIDADAHKLLLDNKEKIIDEIESATRTKVAKFKVVRSLDTVANGDFYLTVKITYEL